MNIPTRTQILQYLEHNPVVSAKELSIALKLTKANIQYHLEKMIREGTIERHLNNLNMNIRGRHEYSYERAKRNGNDNYRRLVDALLTMIFSPNTEILPKDLSYLSRLVFSKYQRHTNMAVDLNHMVEELNTMSYQSHWEAREKGPLIYFKNCPYSTILPTHPELCKIDTAFLSFLLDSNVTQVKKIESCVTQSMCVFQIEMVRKNLN